MTYSVKEIFFTLQGEGANAGRPAVFCRFAGCNLWNGLEADRGSAICRFCDTDFLGTDGTLGGKYRSAQDLAGMISSQWPTGHLKDRLVVLTGGEPLLQVDAALLTELKSHGFEVAVETNGTLLPPPGIDWICVSPKAGTNVILRHGSELKFVFPQIGADPSFFVHWDFERFFLQPKDGPAKAENTRAAIEYCLKNPSWRLSVQTHKIIGVR